jgi:hypothetical protein
VQAALFGGFAELVRGLSPDPLEPLFGGVHFLCPVLAENRRSPMAAFDPKRTLLTGAWRPDVDIKR